MDRRALGFVAIVLIGLMAIVATAGLDDLPRSLRTSVAAARGHLASDRAAYRQNADYVDQALRDEPVLFRDKAEPWRQRLAGDGKSLSQAEATLGSLEQLAKANRRTDSGKVEQALREFDSERQQPLRDASDIRQEAERWLKAKRELPARLASMRASYEAIQKFDLEAATAPARKAMADWPARHDDLEMRIEALKQTQEQGRKDWDSSAELRTAAEENRLAESDFPTLLAASDGVESASRSLKDNAASLGVVAGQLYVGWDKVLLDLDEDGGSGREKVRVVSTRYADGTLTNGQTSSEERWEDLEGGQFRQARESVGMVVARKPAGRFDWEAERVAQPPGYAYVAAPGQANRYGAWSGGMWHWLPEYLILSQLLGATRRPVTVGDLEAYQRARTRGEIFYGRNEEFRSRWSGRWGGGRALPGSRQAPAWSGGGGDSSARSNPSPSTSGWWKERPKAPAFGERGFGGSGYQSRGSYSGSRFQSRGAFGSGVGSFGSRSFSRGGGMRAFSRGGRR